MRKLTITLCVLLLVVFTITSCKERKSNESTDSTEEKSSEDETQSSETEEAEQLKQIEWIDGNTYSYDYTETVTTKDSLGNEKEITIYKSRKPHESDIICDTKICKWCSKELYAENYKIEEYPNINWLRGTPDFSSIFGMFGSLFDGTHYYDLDNNKVRTEWKIKCNYRGPDGFCSLKCQNEYKYR